MSTNKKNLRRVSIVITSQTLHHLEHFAAAIGANNIGKVIDKMVREKMIDLKTTRGVDVVKWSGKNF